MTLNNRQRTKYIITDWITSSLAFFLFNLFRFFCIRIVVDYTTFEGFILSDKILFEQFTIPFVAVVIYWLSGYYNHPLGKSRMEELFSTLSSSVVVTFFIYLALLTNDQLTLALENYKMILVIFADFFILTYIGRFVITSLAIHCFRKDRWKYPSLIVGTSDAAVKTAEKLSRGRFNIKYDIIGCVEIPGETRSEKLNCRIFRLDDMERIIRKHGVQQIFISLQNTDDRKILSLLNHLYPFDVSVKIAPDTFSFVTNGIHLKDIYGEPFIDLTSPQISEMSKNIKRVIDVAASSIALLISALPMLAIAIAIKKSSPGPVFYRQERIGYRQRPFRIVKFRTMYVDAEKNGPALTKDNDSRITPIGHILRKYRIDEIPQFWNVLKGDMSLVGPRPERRYFIDKIIEHAPYFTLIHQVRPGITSWGVVKYGYASNLEEMVKRTRFELIYLQNMSIVVDFKILIYTIKIVLTGVGK